jgi:hypothetical protein
MNEITMTYSGPQVMLDLGEHGTAEATFTDAGHAHLSAYSDGSRPGDLVFKGRHWYASVHLHAEHGWGENPGTGEYRHQFTDAHSDKVIAPTYRAKLVDILSAAVRALVEQQPDILYAAEHNHLENELDRARHEAEQARAEANTKQDTADELARQLAELEAQR